MKPGISRGVCLCGKRVMKFIGKGVSEISEIGDPKCYDCCKQDGEVSDEEIARREKNGRELAAWKASTAEADREENRQLNKLVGTINFNRC